MDKVTQQNAANAEESASASEEMSTQAGQMKGFVEDLISLVGGASSAINSNILMTSKAMKRNNGTHSAVHHHPIMSKPSKNIPVKSSEVHPAQVIPLDDDFKDF